MPLNSKILLDSGVCMCFLSALMIQCFFLLQEIARRLAEHEKKEYRKNREREKEKERERERERLALEKMGMERRRHSGSSRVTFS